MHETLLSTFLIKESYTKRIQQMGLPNVTKPLFRWAGSKRKLLPAILEIAPATFSRYFEPFAGSACVFFALRPERAILADTNEHLIHAYKMVRHSPTKVLDALQQFKITSEEYYHIRSLKPEHLSPTFRAARFVYLNRFCFNGVYRTNRDGSFNVPRGTRTGNLPTGAEITSSATLLKHASLRAGDFERTLRDAGRGDFVYLDPPYAIGNRYRGEYGPGSFRNEDIGRFLRVVDKLTKKGALVLISYSDTPGITQQFEQAMKVRRLAVRRHVAGFTSGRGFANELLITNY